MPIHSVTAHPHIAILYALLLHDRESSTINSEPAHIMTQGRVCIRLTVMMMMLRELFIPAQACDEASSRQCELDPLLQWKSAAQYIVRHTSVQGHGTHARYIAYITIAISYSLLL